MRSISFLKRVEVNFLKYFILKCRVETPENTSSKEGRMPTDNGGSEKTCGRYFG
jgi:hypothetical protein